MKLLAILGLVVIGAVASTAEAQDQTKTADKPFVSGGKVDVHLDAGDYEVRAGTGNHVRVMMTGKTANATVAVDVAGSHADVTVRNTPHTNFHCTVEVPKTSDVAIRLSAGDLTVGPINGSKDIESTAGDVKISVGSPDDYSSVDASVSVGDLSGGPFGSPDSGIVSHAIKKTGKGRHTLRVHLGAGDLKLQ